MTLGFIGLGKMGQQMVGRLIEAGHHVVVLDVNPEALRAAVQLGAEAATDRSDLLRQLGAEAVVWLMIPSAAVDAELQQLAASLPHDSVVIDGGNSDFRQTVARSKKLAERGATLVDVGTSGGILGLKDGFSLMIGGPEDVVKRLDPLFVALAPPGGYRYFGPSGAGHFIKMVHNAVEYGLMESYAEGYRLLREGPYADLDLAVVGQVWEHGSIVASRLNQLASQVLAVDPELEESNGVANESGEAGWALEVASARGIDMPALKAAHEVRVASQSGQVSFATRLLAALRHAFGGHEVPKL